MKIQMRGHQQTLHNLEKPSASSRRKKDMSRSKKGQAEHDREVRKVANEYLKKGV